MALQVSDFCIKKFLSKRKREVQTVPLNDMVLDVLLTEKDDLGKEILGGYKNLLTDLEWKYIQYRFQEELSNQIAKKVHKSYTSITSLGNRVRRKLKNILKETLQNELDIQA